MDIRQRQEERAKQFAIMKVFGSMFSLLCAWIMLTIGAWHLLSMCIPQTGAIPLTMLFSIGTLILSVMFSIYILEVKGII